MRTLILVSDTPVSKGGAAASHNTTIDTATNTATNNNNNNNNNDTNTRHRRMRSLGELSHEQRMKAAAAVSQTPPRSLIDEVDTDEEGSARQQQRSLPQIELSLSLPSHLPLPPQPQRLVPPRFPVDKTGGGRSGEEGLSSSSSSASSSAKQEQLRRRRQQQHESREPPSSSPIPSPIPSPSASSSSSSPEPGDSSNSTAQQNNNNNNNKSPHQSTDAGVPVPNRSPKTAAIATALGTGLLCSSTSFVTTTAAVDDTTTNEDDTDDEEDFVDLSGFFRLLQRKEWDKVLEFLLEHPNASKQTIHCQGGVTYLLHIVLRHGPPLPVVELVVSQDRGTKATASTPTSIWRQTDTKGRLPLHAACSCGPESYPEVIKWVILADPGALRIRTTNDTDAKLPLHLAVASGASERVVQLLLIHYPSAAFVTDGHGKIALDYARGDGGYGYGHGHNRSHNRLVVALELAPMLLEAARAAERYVEESSHRRLAALAEEHAARREELRANCERETMLLVEKQVRSNKDLAEEISRNRMLATTLLEVRESYRGLLKDRAELRRELHREIIGRRAHARMRDDELKRILLLGTVTASDDDDEHDNNNDNNSNETDIENDNENDEGADPLEAARAKKASDHGGSDGADDLRSRDTDDDHDNEDLDEEGSVRSPLAMAKIPLPTLLTRISKGYEASKRRNRSYKEQLNRQRHTVKNLNLLLAAKEEELAQVQKTARTHERDLATANDRVEQLAALHQMSLAKLAKAQDEADKWKRGDAETERNLVQAQRRLRIQEKRLSGFQALLTSMGSLAEVKLGNSYSNSPGRSLVGSNSSCCNSTVTSGSHSHSGRRKETEVSAAIQTAAAAVATVVLDDSGIGSSGNSNSSLGENSSSQRREADLSAELSAELVVTSVIESKSHSSEDDHEIPNGETRKTLPQPQRNQTPLSETVTPIGKGMQPIDHDGDSKWIRGTPQTLSVLTATTAGSDEDVADEERREIVPPRTPPVPDRVGGQGPQNDRFSPLASPRLKFPE
eukprot:jgi/Psemu1/24213/gm1.24213_g